MNREDYRREKEDDAKADLAELSKPGGFLGLGMGAGALERLKIRMEQRESRGDFEYQGALGGKISNTVLAVFLLVLAGFLIIRFFELYL